MSKIDLTTAQKMRRRGYTLQAIADRFGVTREAVRKCLKAAEARG